MKRILFFLLTISILISCEEAINKPIKNDGKAPAQVANVKVENLSGAAKLTYTIPSDADLLYIMARYTSKDGMIREFKASYYENSITVVGFEKAEKYNVELFTVDEGENVSLPVVVEVNPLDPPYIVARKSLETQPDFGGIKTSFKNPERANLAIVVLTLDEMGKYVPCNTNYTDLREGAFSVRGLEAESTKFGIYVRDRWNHVSDTLFVTLTPLFEMKLDKKLMKGLVLPTDAGLGYGGSINGLLNENYTDIGYHTGDASPLPSWFTLDLGVKAKISRLIWWMRDQNEGGRWYYALHNPRVVEIYGSDNPNPDGSWDSWTLIVKHEQIKPSGLPVGQLSQADRDAAAEGETVNFPLETKPFRYIRFKTLRNWSDGTYVNFAELTVYGEPQK